MVIRSATGGSGSVTTAIATAGGVGLSLPFAGEVFRIGWLSAGMADPALSCCCGGSGVFVSPALETSALFLVETSLFVPTLAFPPLVSGVAASGIAAGCIEAGCANAPGANAARANVGCADVSCANVAADICGVRPPAMGPGFAGDVGVSPETRVGTEAGVAFEARGAARTGAFFVVCSASAVFTAARVVPVLTGCGVAFPIFCAATVSVGCGARD